MVVLTRTELLSVFVVSPGHLLTSTLAIKEAFHETAAHTLKVHYIIDKHDVNCHMNCGLIPSNLNVTTSDHVVMLVPDLLKCVSSLLEHYS